MKLKNYGWLFRLTGLQWWAQRTTPVPNIRITYTHEVKEKDMGNFESLIHRIKETRTFITPVEFFSFYRGQSSLPASSAMVTFDDGRMSSYHAAKKVLARYGIKAIFFVPTAVLVLRTPEQMKHFLVHNVNGGKLPPWQLDQEDYQVLTAEAIRDLAAEGHVILPHTHSHADLRDIQDEQTVRRELLEPRQILADLLQKDIREICAMSIPVGTERQVDSYAYQQIRRTYEFCFTALAGTNSLQTQPHYLCRDYLSPTYSAAYVSLALSGAHDVYYRLKMRRFKKRTNVKSQQT